MLFAGKIPGVLVPQQVKAGYDKEYAVAVNIASPPTAMVIPPNTAFNMYSLIAGGASILSLFLSGYVVGFLWVLGIIVLAIFLARKRNYPIIEHDTSKSVAKVLIDSIPSLLLTLNIIRGIMSGLFTTIEASAVSVIYALFLALFYYKTVT
ncbi:TRAP transporter large permease subunit [Fundicoccus sp. Sow4_H7]|uniref:TRAP transporter large permease subunit n=1 Tax=Fundicoccus sp. Sow4_H7 TaxID=3438784 RepID=UPI003F93177F